MASNRQHLGDSNLVLDWQTYQKCSATTNIMERTFTQVYHVKLIRFTLARKVYIIVTITEPFLFIAFITQICLVKMFTKFLLGWYWLQMLLAVHILSFKYHAVILCNINFQDVIVVCSVICKQTHLFWILCKSYFINSSRFFFYITWYSFVVLCDAIV